MNPSLLYQDATLLVLNKPVGLPCVALQDPEQPTVARWLGEKFPELLSIGKPGECGLVHRLDNDTSGVLVVARTEAAHKSLREIWKTPQTRKLYRARVSAKQPGAEGAAVSSSVAPSLSPGATIDFPIGHSAKSTRKMIAIRSAFDLKKIRGNAQPCSTKIVGIQQTPALPAELLAEQTAPRHDLTLELSGGVRHQLRVHLAVAGFPILGDDRYGGAPADRLYLHAWRVEFTLEGRSLAFEARDGWPGADLPI